MDNFLSCPHFFHIYYYRHNTTYCTIIRQQTQYIDYVITFLLVIHISTAPTTITTKRIFNELLTRLEKNANINMLTCAREHVGLFKGG